MIMKIIHLVTIFSIGLMFASCGSDTQSKNNSSDPGTSENVTTASKSNNPKIKFSAYDLDGTLHSSDEWIGKQPVVINFWGTWCPPCRKEIPDLVRLYKEYNPKGIEILGLAVKDRAEKVAQFSRQNGMDWVMMMADQNLAIRYRITGVPTTIFVNRDGEVVGRFVGPRDYETFKKAFELIL